MYVQICVSYMYMYWVGKSQIHNLSCIYNYYCLTCMHVCVCMCIKINVCVRNIMYKCVYVCILRHCATGGEKVHSIDCRKWLSSDGYFTMLYKPTWLVHICRYSLRCFVSTLLVLPCQESRRVMTSVSLATPFPREPISSSVSMPTTKTQTTETTQRPLIPTDLVQSEESEQAY